MHLVAPKLSLCRHHRPLSRALARRRYGVESWLAGNNGIGRVVTIRQLSFSQLHHSSLRDAEFKTPKDDSMLGEREEPIRGSGELPRRIHILGVGNVGTFLAHSLAGIPNRPPITLLLRRWERLRDYRAKGSVLRLTTHNMTVVRRGFEVEAAERQSSDRNQFSPLPPAGYGRSLNRDWPASQGGSLPSQPLSSEKPSLEKSGRDLDISSHSDTSTFQSDERQAMRQYEFTGLNSQYPDAEDTIAFDNLINTSPNSAKRELEPDQDNHGDQGGVIHHLIVTVKTPHTVNAIRQHAHRLNSDSTILFLQNGMGMIDEVNKQIFPLEKDRPHYMIGVLSHGLHGKGPFDVVHAGEGTIALGLLTEEKEYPASARYLLRTMTRTPVFVAVGFNPTDLLQQQLDKLAVNAVINPLTAILDCLNSQLLDNFYIKRVVRLLLAEISVVFRSLPELKNVPNVDMRFDTARLESLVVRVARLTGVNRSSMLQDVRDGRQTEIDYINGYVVRRGEERGIHCVTNYMVMQMVKAKDKMVAEERGGIVPLQRSRERK